MSGRLRFVAVALAAAVANPAQAQQFVFATPQEGAAVLGARDEYLRAMGDYERSARLRTAEPVDEARLAAQMATMTLPWTDAERGDLQPILARLERFLAGIRWRGPGRILLVKAADAHEEGLPHTRGDAIVLPEGFLRTRSPQLFAYVLSHEAFHVLSRADPKLREELYAAIGFRPCATIDIPAEIARRRLSNPDAPQNRHVVPVVVRGRRVEALPYVMFNPASSDPRGGFKTQMLPVWLVVERSGDRCRALPEWFRPQEIEGLEEQIGRNTRYTEHPEEIIADNFALLFLGAEGVPSPDILDRIRRLVTK